MGQTQPEKSSHMPERPLVALPGVAYELRPLSQALKCRHHMDPAWLSRVYKKLSPPTLLGHATTLHSGRVETVVAILQMRNL